MIDFYRVISPHLILTIVKVVKFRKTCIFLSFPFFVTHFGPKSDTPVFELVCNFWALKSQLLSMSQS